MRINKYFPFAFLYFFVNSLALPFGLTYTAILSPLFYWWIAAKRKQEVLLPFIFFILVFGIIHKSQGVDTNSYILSVLNFTTVYIFCQAFYTFLKNCNNPEKILWKLLVINFILCIIAIPLYFTPFYEILWIQQYLTEGVDNFLRLKLFTYEASYYATLFTPLFFFFLLQIIFKQNKKNAWLLSAMIFLPYFLSFSLGVISCILVAVVLTYILYLKTLTRKKRVFTILLLTTSILFFGFVALAVFFPDNILFTRIENIFSGKDSSGRGRTFEAFELANKILAQKSWTWGIGPGQVKEIGAEIIRDYYLYPMDYNVFAIPNAVAETLVIFGWVGLLLRLFIEIFLFFYTRVWTNYYRLLLFFFMFFYQFTGSFITNLAEYVIWILAFTNVFSQFDIRLSAKNKFNIATKS
jgi:hypothetical protein